MNEKHTNMSKERWAILFIVSQSPDLTWIWMVWTLHWWIFWLTLFAKPINSKENILLKRILENSHCWGKKTQNKSQSEGVENQ